VPPPRHFFRLPSSGTELASRVLDIGCAEGLEAIALARLGAAQVVGIDIRIDEARAARLKPSSHPMRRSLKFPTISSPRPVMFTF
jgi:2-polyprenyl-3-methyl-5-hydroxy-6-metoxy-1,4-benzoquinol methylase